MSSILPVAGAVFCGVLEFLVIAHCIAKSTRAAVTPPRLTDEQYGTIGCYTLIAAFALAAFGYIIFSFGRLPQG